jgi:hypothetical protein
MGDKDATAGWSGIEDWGVPAKAMVPPKGMELALACGLRVLLSVMVPLCN